MKSQSNITAMSIPRLQEGCKGEERTETLFAGIAEYFALGGATGGRSACPTGPSAYPGPSRRLPKYRTAKRAPGSLYGGKYFQ